jgi:uncharacterized membrane protein
MYFTGLTRRNQRAFLGGIPYVTFRSSSFMTVKHFIFRQFVGLLVTVIRKVIGTLKQYLGFQRLNNNDEVEKVVRE